jgi:hypothetical protein
MRYRRFYGDVTIVIVVDTVVDTGGGDGMGRRG